jgi:predicted 3-demethylubiquinone-9 3-methyltransferase (glyoxalase superfamily)
MEQAMAIAKNTICLWYDKDAEAAARFYAETFPDSSVRGVHRAPGDFPSGKAGDVPTVEFTVFGIPCLGLNGGATFKHNEAFSFQIATEDQDEISRQITPRVLTEALAAGGDGAKRAFEAMMGMRKIDVATIKAVNRHGKGTPCWGDRRPNGTPLMRVLHRAPEGSGSRVWDAGGGDDCEDPSGVLSG